MSDGESGRENPRSLPPKRRAVESTLVGRRGVPATAAAAWANAMAPRPLPGSPRKDGAAPRVD